jgi:hypothetical protein
VRVTCAIDEGGHAAALIFIAWAEMIELSKK